MGLHVIFIPGTFDRVLRTLDQILGLEVKSICCKEIKYYTPI